MMVNIKMMRIHYKDNNDNILNLALLMLKTYKSTSLSETEMQVAQLGPFIPELRPSQAVTADSLAQVALPELVRSPSKCASNG